jgi:hypothetical protein
MEILRDRAGAAGGPPSLAVLRPTRGLEFSESADSIDFALSVAIDSECIQSRVRQFRQWELPIPDSFNVLVREFLQSPIDYAWILEEDVVAPLDAIPQMLAMDADVAAINYNLKVGGPNRNSEIRTLDGELHTLGTGCMLIKRSVFEVLPDPWFRTDLAPGMRHPGSATPKPFLDLVPNSFEYGGHDGFFTLSAIRAGLKVVSVPDRRCAHLRLDAAGAVNSNQGCHVISRVE